MLKVFKAIAALLVFVAVYLLASTLIFFMVLYMNGGSVYMDMNWRAYGLAVFADAFAGYLGVVVGRAAGVWLVPYPARFVGITFIVLLGLIWVPLTLIYAMGGAGILFGGVDMRDWPPEGELGEYFSGLVRAVVAVISAWVMLVRRDAIADDVDTGSAEKPKAPSRNTEARSAPTADRVSPEVAAIYLKLDRLMLDEKAQVANLPEPFRSEVLKGADCDKIAGTAGEFGRDPRNPIPVNGPLGEVIYLTNLRTATSQKIMFHRLGSAANLDIFEIVSVDGTVWDFLCLDVYHPRKSRLAPAGYRIAAEADRKSLLFGANEYVARFPELSAVSAHWTERAG